MNFDFGAVMSLKSNEELYAILAEEQKYQPEAITAAKKEIESRHLSEVEISTTAKKYQEQKEEENIKANAPLEFYYYLLILVLPVISMFILSGYFKGNGYDRKSRQLSRFTAYVIGIIFSLVLFVKFFE